MYKHVGGNKNPQMKIVQAQVVYQQNVQHEQNPENRQTRPVYHQPVHVGGNYQHPMQPPRIRPMLQGHTQPVYHPPVHIDGNYQQPIQPPRNGLLAKFPIPANQRKYRLRQCLASALNSLSPFPQTP